MPYFDVKEILSTAIMIIDKHGFVPSKVSADPTWMRVNDYVNDHVTRLKDSSVNKIGIPIADESLKIIDWVSSLQGVQCKSKYMTTVKQVLERGYCGKHLFGLLTSLIPIYREHVYRLGTQFD